MADHRVERRKGTVVHVRRGELHIAQGRDAEKEATRLAGELRVLTEVERSVLADARPELRDRRGSERLTAEQCSEVTSRAASFAEEEQRALLLLGGKRVVVMRQIAIEW